MFITELACNISEIMIANGKVSLNADQATYICDSGYELSDTKTFTCDPNTRQWTSSPQMSSLQLPTCSSKHLFVSLFIITSCKCNSLTYNNKYSMYTFKETVVVSLSQNCTRFSFQKLCLSHQRVHVLLQ